MIIAQISDTHIQSASGAAAPRLEDLARTVASINAMTRRPDVVLHTGDVAHDATPEDYAAARTMLSRLSVPVFAIVGNRDRRRPFIDAFGGDGYLGKESNFVQYAVDLGPIRIVAADTQDDESALGGFCDERAAQLRGLLSAGSGQPTLVFAHHPPVELPGMAGPSLQYREGPQAAALARCIGECRSVIGVVAGHVHRSRAVALGGVTLTTVPSIAADLSREKEGETYLRRPIYQVHTIEGSTVNSASVVL